MRRGLSCKGAGEGNFWSDVDGLDSKHRGSYINLYCVETRRTVRSKNSMSVNLSVSRYPKNEGCL